MQWYEEEVLQLETARASQPVNHPPVFYGSSSIRLWETLAEDVHPSIVNVGFGGSTLEACDHFFFRLVPPLEPRSLLLYAGDNDLGDGRPVEQVVQWFRSLLGKVDAALGPIPFGFLSIKPSPARRHLLDSIGRVNASVRQLLETRESGYFVDVYAAMLDANGDPRSEWFAEDGLHLSRAGYRLWGEALAPYRNRILALPTRL